jgi:hypothetical protein
VLAPWPVVRPYRYCASCSPAARARLSPRLSPAAPAPDGARLLTAPASHRPATPLRFQPHPFPTAPASYGGPPPRARPAAPVTYRARFQPRPLRHAARPQARRVSHASQSPVTCTAPHRSWPPVPSILELWCLWTGDKSRMTPTNRPPQVQDRHPPAGPAARRGCAARRVRAARRGRAAGRMAGQAAGGRSPRRRPPVRALVRRSRRHAAHYRDTLPPMPDHRRPRQATAKTTPGHREDHARPPRRPRQATRRPRQATAKTMPNHRRPCHATEDIDSLR